MNASSIQQKGVAFDGTRRDVTIDEVIADQGRRTPDSTVAPRRFRMAFILVTKDGQTALVFNESVAVLPDIPGTGAEISAIRRAPSYTPEEITAYQDEWRQLFQS